MCHWRRVQNVYQRCGHVENMPEEMIECGSSRCKFSAYHPPTCQPPSCTKTCLQYRTYPEHYTLNKNAFCRACTAAGYR
ncbi:hypothetical protein K523DRAFT_350796 [Schizophyllum commune Tattone D]|nr:hypothetical protein K525DRAFT_203188 [Schizophyllum commune Loenen D]KAI5831390.1 hypothetical protein K523DRAFT_350796 [Schizophyllum commune Tattone D]